MAKTIVGLYDEYTTARRVIDELEKIGFGKDHLRMGSHDAADRTDYDMDVAKDATPEALSSYGISDEESHFYAEGVRRGGALVVVRVHEKDVDKAVEIMVRHNPVRYEDRMNAYKKEGFKNHDTSAKAYSAEDRMQERDRYAGERKQRLQEIEENLKVGKREFVSGGVRVHKYVDTERIEETLRLREEHVDVDRKRVDRAATPDELNSAFKEDTIEMVERSEEAVVEKEARVTGEVTLGKDVNVRDETVGDTVRRTRIEIEKIPTDKLRQQEDTFRQHYQNSLAKTGNKYDYYRPAYEYGYAAGNTYRDRDYSAVERDLRTDYNDRYKDESAWDEVKDAVRHGYQRAKAAVS